MRKASEDIKKNFPREKEVIKGSKKIAKPWVMQFKWHSEEAFRKNSWFTSYNPDWITHYDKYLDTEHALQMLNRDLRSFSWMTQQWRDRDSRLFNKITGEILPLEVQDKKVRIIWNLLEK